MNIHIYIHQDNETEILKALKEIKASLATDSKIDEQTQKLNESNENLKDVVTSKSNIQ